MSMITAALGVYAAIGISGVGALVAKTFDGSLMSINYAQRGGGRLCVHAGRFRAPMDRVGFRNAGQARRKRGQLGAIAH